MLICKTSGNISTSDVIAIAAAVIAAIAMILQLTSSRTETKSTSALQLLTDYLDIKREDRKQKRANPSSNPKINAFWNEILDLMYTQYHLWLNGHIDKSMMSAWCITRRKDYKNNDPAHPGYGDTWNALIEANYFPEEKFRIFMDEVHGKSGDSSGKPFEIKYILKRHRKDLKNS